jgi:hypothetical protein
MARRSHSHTTDQKRRLVASSLRGRAVRLACRDSKWSRRRFRFFGSARESGETCDLRGFSSFVQFDSRSRRRCGNVGTRVLCGFPSSEGGQNRCGRGCIIPPSERHFHGAAPGLSATLAGICCLGGRRSQNNCLSESRVECTFLQILAQSRFFTRRLPWLTVFLTCLICPPACRNVGVGFRRLVNSEQLGLTRTRYYWAVSNFHERTEASHAYEPRRTLG